jgi:hypothetical protein
MPKKLIVVVAGIAILAGVVGVASAAATAPTHRKLGGWAAEVPTAAGAAGLAAVPDITAAQRLHFIMRTTTFSFVDNPPAGDSNGDLFTFSGPLLTPGTHKQVGFVAGHCTFVDLDRAGLGECEVTVTPSALHNLAAASQLTLQGFGDNTPLPFKNAVNGGTGIYRNARGQAVGTALPSGDLDLVISLLP